MTARTHDSSLTGAQQVDAHSADAYPGGHGRRAAKGRLRGRQPKLSVRQQAELRRMHASGDYSIADLAELFTVSRPTVYRTLQRSPARVSGISGLRRSGRLSRGLVVERVQEVT
jgi:Helix-turn-helix domain of resolvase